MESAVSKRHEYVAHASAVRCLSFAPKTTSILASGGDDCRVNIWKMTDSNVTNVWTLSNNKSAIECVCFDTEEQCVISGGVSGAIRVFDLNEGKLVRSLNGHLVNTSSLHYHPYGEFIVSGSWDKNMKVWDVRNKRCIQTYSGHRKEVTCVRFSPDGRWVASAGKDNQLLIWDLVAGKLLQSLVVPHSHLTTFEFCPMEFILAGVTTSKTVRLWDLESFESMGITAAETNTIRSLCFSPHSKLFCTASENCLKSWNWDPIRCKTSVEVGWDRVSDMCFNKDNSKVLAGSFISNFVSIWSVDYQQSSPTYESRAKTASAAAGYQSPPPSTIAPTTTSNGAGADVLGKNISSHRKPDVISSEMSDKIARSEIRSKQGGGGAGGGKGLLESKEDAPPEVNWESGISAKDMAASMGESFIRKMREEKERVTSQQSQQQQLPVINQQKQEQRQQEEEVKKKAASVLDDDRYSMEALQRLLPTSPAKPYRDNDSDDDSNKEEAEIGRKSLQSPPKSVNNGKSSSNRRTAPTRAVLEEMNPAFRKGSLLGKESPIVVVAPSAGAASGSRVGNLGSGQSGMNSHNAVDDEEGEEDEGGKKRIQAMNIVGNRVATKTEGGAAITLSAGVLSPSDVIQNGAKLLSQLSTRIGLLRILRKYWEMGDMREAIQQLQNIYEGSRHDHNQMYVIADFFLGVDLRAASFTLDICVSILPILEAMTNDSIEYIVQSGCKGILYLLETFGDLINQTRSVMSIGGGFGVDISREDRLNKCNLCHSIFIRIKGILPILRNKFRYSKKILAYLEDIKVQLNDFC